MKGGYYNIQRAIWIYIYKVINVNLKNSFVLAMCSDIATNEIHQYGAFNPLQYAAMPVKEASSKKRLNLMVSDNSSRLYAASKEPLEWFVKHEYEFQGEVKTSYRKYYDSVAGKIIYLGYDDHGSTKITLTDGELNISIAIANPASGWLSRATKAFIAVAANADLSKRVEVAFYKSKSVKTFDDGTQKEFENVRCAFNYWDVELEARSNEERPAMIDIKDVPQAEKVVKKNKTTRDFTKQDDHYEDILKTMIAKIPEKQDVSAATVSVKHTEDALDEVAGATTSTEEATSTEDPHADEKTPAPVANDDDLPFK
jgi:hypothetical protein